MPDLTRDEAITMLPKSGLYVGGDWRRESSAGERAHIDPSTGEQLGSFLLAGFEDVDDAVAAARSAFTLWRTTPPATRRDVLLRIADAIEANAAELAALQSLEMGMPLRSATAAINHASEWFRYYGGWADKIEGYVCPVAPGSVLDYVLSEPYGVVAAIIPWNGPIITLALKAAPALAAGNSVVVKPSELAPFSSLLLAEILDSLGLPAGLINVIPGDGVAGAALCGHGGVDKITFTGGAKTAHAVATAAAQHQTPLVLELGGKSASIVFGDADPQVAGKLAAILGVQQSSGQGCYLPTRVFVERLRYEDVLECIVATVRRFKLGNPFDPTTSMGPVAGAATCDRILGIIERARVEEHGHLVVGGRRSDGELACGFYVEPTVFRDVEPTSPLAQEEIFGPVLAVAAFDDEDEAIQLANGTRYGLAGYVWTNDLGRAHRVAAALEAGTVAVNGMAALPPSAPFGGWRASGSGIEGGPWGLREFLRLKNVHVALG